MNWLTQLVSEGDGNPSTMRIATLLIVASVMVTWTVTSIKAGAMQPMSPETLGAVLGSLGIKAIQRKVENSTPPDPPKPTP